MREVQLLCPAPASDAAPTVEKTAWGTPERVLALGLVLLLLAAIAAAIFYSQIPKPFAGLSSPEIERQRVERLSTMKTILYFRQVILPGIELHDRPGLEGRRSSAYLGLSVTAVLGAIGLLLAAIGGMGIMRRLKE